MANEYNNKRYYWIKLRDTFMTSDAVDFLMAQTDGANYVVLYQMLCLKTINTGGELSRTIGEMIVPYDIDKIVRDTKWFSKDTIIVALELYKRLGLVFANENGNLVITDFCKMVGSETQSAVYKQGTPLLENFQLNSNRDKDIKRLDIRDKEIEYYTNKELNSIFNEFLLLRKKLKAVNNERAINSLINKLSLYDDDTKIKMIDKSIVSSWKDVYELKEDKKDSVKTHNEKVMEEFLNEHE